MYNFRRYLIRIFLLTAVMITAILTVSCSDSQGPLTVYSGRSETLVKPVIDKFILNTGIKVVVKYAKTTELVSTLLEEGSKTPADLFLAQDPGGLGAVEGILAPLPKETLENVPLWAKSDKGNWVGLSGRSRTVVYNTDKIKSADLPETLNGFTNPVWKGRVGWAPRNGSFQTMVSAMRHLWGDEKTKNWLKSMALNGAKEYSNNSTQVIAVNSGEIDIGLVNHYYLHRILAEKGSLNAKNHHLSEGGPGSLVMVSGVGILKGSSNSKNAKRFVDYMLSDEAQKYFAEKTFEYPVISSVQTSSEIEPLKMVPSVPLTKLGDLKGTQGILREVGLIS